MSRWGRRATRTAVRGVALFALWMLLVDNLHQPEIVTGAVAAALVALAAEIVAALRPEAARLSPAMLRFVYRPFGLLVVDTLRVSVALLRRLSGREVSGHLRAVRYRAVSDGPGDRARRILTAWGVSLPPNRYAVGIDQENGYLLVHELVAGSGALDPLELG